MPKFRSRSKAKEDVGSVPQPCMYAAKGFGCRVVLTLRCAQQISYPPKSDCYKAGKRHKIQEDHIECQAMKPQT